MRILLRHPAGPPSASSDELRALLADPTAFVWADMTGPESHHLELMEKTFGFHPLAIEDTRNQRQRPKVEEYADHLFLILNPIARDEEGVSFRELDVFIGRNYLVTVHPEPDPVVDEVERRLGRRGNGKPVTPGYLLYALVDTVVDTYFPVLDQIDGELSDLEDELLEHPQEDALRRLLALKRSLVEVRRVIGPQRDMFNVLTRRDLELIEPELARYHFRDVYDHLLRITDTVDTFRDLLSSMVDVYMSAISNRLNTVVNRLTRVTVVIGAFAVITGFYGMNFSHTWPPLDHPWGTGFTLLLMVAVAFGLHRFFLEER
jgi:magnesium transporter